MEKNQFLSFFSFINPPPTRTDCESLIRKMLVLQPNKRVTVSQIKRHRWMLMETLDTTPTATSPYVVGDESGTLCGTAACEPNDQILKIMQNLGIDTQRTRQSLKANNYDHYTAFYLLLLERIKHKDNNGSGGVVCQPPTDLQKYPSVESQRSQNKRRPSSIAEQAMRKIGISGIGIPPR